jgi:hypothetical protein
MVSKWRNANLLEEESKAHVLMKGLDQCIGNKEGRGSMPRSSGRLNKEELAQFVLSADTLCVLYRYHLPGFLHGEQGQRYRPMSVSLGVLSNQHGILDKLEKLSPTCRHRMCIIQILKLRYWAGLVSKQDRNCRSTSPDPQMVRLQLILGYAAGRTDHFVLPIPPFRKCNNVPHTALPGQYGHKPVKA